MGDADQDSSKPTAPAGIIAATTRHTVAEVARLMRDNGIGCVVVTDENDKLSGIISERDIVIHVVAAGLDPETAYVAERMAADVATCPEGTSMAEARDIMAQRKIRHLPVVASDVVVGMISSRDVMREQLEAARATRVAAEEIAKLSKSFKALDFDNLIDVITREVPKLFQAERAVLHLNAMDSSDPGDATVVRHRCHCTDRDRRQRTDIPDQADWGGQILCHDVPACCVKLCGESKTVIIPLEVSGFISAGTDRQADQHGYLCICGVDSGVAASRDLIFYQGTLIREILCGVLSNARMYRYARDSYMIDPLTGIGTRRLFEEKLAEESIRSGRYDRTFCMAIVDVDHFKTVNDELGHDVGDRVLKEVGQFLAYEKRQTDVLARYGGDEFVLLMPETCLENAVTVMERMRKRAEEIDLPNGHVVTLSCGVAEQLADQDGSGRDLFRRSDLALFEAKHAGRDCTRSWRNVSDRFGFDDFLHNDVVLGLQQQVVDLSAQSKDMFAEGLWGLVRAIEARDPFTKSHSVNVMHYAVAIAEVIGLGEDNIDVIRRAAMIHDIGMIGVPDEILRNPEPLTDEQRAKVEQHPRIGAHILQQMRSLEREIPIVRHHHERWDGQGYPNGISGTRIPADARILSVADAFDAITSNRSHRRSRTVAQALDIISDGAKKQFDPAPVRAIIQWVKTMGQELGRGTDVTAEELRDVLHGTVAVP